MKIIRVCGLNVVVSIGKVQMEHRRHSLWCEMTHAHSNFNLQKKYPSNIKEYWQGHPRKMKVFDDLMKRY